MNFLNHRFPTIGKYVLNYRYRLSTDMANIGPIPIPIPIIGQSLKISKPPHRKKNNVKTIFSKLYYRKLRDILAVVHKPVLYNDHLLQIMREKTYFIRKSRFSNVFSKNGWVYTGCIKKTEQIWNRSQRREAA